MEPYADHSILGVDMCGSAFNRDMFGTEERSLGYYYPTYTNSMMWSQESMYAQEPCLAHGNAYASSSGYDTPIQYNMDEFEGFQVPELQAEISAAGQKRKRASFNTIERDQQTKIQRQKPRSCTPSDSSTPNVRKHYAVEKRYRSTLNDRYATLARLVSSEEAQSICRSECSDWELGGKLECEGKRQSKTTTLSVAIETVALLDRACLRKARELEGLVNRLGGIVQAASSSTTR